MGRPDYDLNDFHSLMESGRQLGTARGNARAVRRLLAEDGSCGTDLRALGWNERRLRLLLLLPALPANEEEAPDDAPAGEAPPAADARLDYGTAFARAERSLAAFVASGRPYAEPPGVPAGGRRIGGREPLPAVPVPGGGAPAAGGRPIRE